MCRAIEWALQRENSIDSPSLIINIGRDDNNLTILEIANLVKQALPNIEINVNKNAEFDKRSYAVDFSLFKKIAPDYYPRFKIQDSIDRLLIQLCL